MIPDILTKKPRLNLAIISIYYNLMLLRNFRIQEIIINNYGRKPEAV